MTGLQSPFSPCRLAAAAVLAGLLLAASPALAQQQAESPPAPGLGVVEIEGKAIETLTLISRAGREVTFTKPQGRVEVPPGQYRVTEVVVAEGYHFTQGKFAEGSDWFTVATDEPAKLAVGAPLYSTVTASRRGSVLKLDYTLVDAAGLEYSSGVSGSPPTFKVFQGDREVGSGTFEYG